MSKINIISDGDDEGEGADVALDTGADTSEGDTEEQQAGASEEDEDLLADDDGENANEVEEEDAGDIDEDIPEPESLTENHKTWINRTKRANKRLVKQNEELERKLASIAEMSIPEEPEEKPTLASCDMDEDRFAQAILDYNAQVAKATEAKEKVAKQAQEFLAAYHEKQKSYKKQRAEVVKSTKAFEEHERAVMNDFNITKQDVIIAYSENPVALIHALGKDEKRRKELAGITDLPEFIFRMGKLDQTLKHNLAKKERPSPDTRLVTESPNKDTKLEQLRRQAEKTGNYTAVIQYKRQMKMRGK